MPKKAPYAASEAEPFALPSDLCSRLSEAGGFTLAPELCRQIESEFELFVRFQGYERSAQTEAEVAKQLGRVSKAIVGLKDALSQLGPDAQEALDNALCPPGAASDLDPMYPIAWHVERLRRAAEEVRKRHADRSGKRGPTIVRGLTRMLKKPYEAASGRMIGTSLNDPFIRFVLAAHDAMPLRLQLQNPEGKKGLRPRGATVGREAVREALEHMRNELRDSPSDREDNSQSTDAITPVTNVSEDQNS
jgi:hypothetical protein